MKKTILLLLCALLPIWGANAARQNETVLRGSAMEESGAPASFATAFLSNAEGALVCGTTADENGRFELKAAQGTYTLTGEITTINTAYSDRYKNITVTIVVEGFEDKPIQCFRLEGEGIEGLMPKDKITVEGTLKNYHGTVEFDAGCKCLAIEKSQEEVKLPETTDEIMDALYALEAGESLPGTYTLKGVITEVQTAYSAEFKNVSVVIKVAGHEDRPVLCYRLEGEGADKIQAGDTITVKGTLKNYNGTREFNAGCTILEV